jgi:peptide/nickel transport system substrate-binding protein
LPPPEQAFATLAAGEYRMTGEASMRATGKSIAFVALALPCLLVACRRQPPAGGPGTATFEGPHQGGQVIIGTPQDVTTLNEYQSAGDASEYAIIDLMFPSLMVEQPDYELHPPSFAPRLATSWEFSQDNRILTFHLRPDARWSDGQPVTADDVRFTFLVQKDRRIDSPGLEIKDFISDVEVVDPHTVRFHFTRVYPYQLMDANDGHIVPAHAWGKIPFEKWRNTDFEPILVTSGPFRLASHVRSQTLLLARDPLYWGHPRPYLDRVIFQVIPDMASEVNQLLAGVIDMVQAVPPRDADRIRADPDLDLVEFPSRVWGFIAWNNRKPLFADRRVRRALTLAINRKAAVDTVYHGFARLSHGPVLSSMWAYNRNLPDIPYDPTQARQLLAEAGWTRTNSQGILERDDRPFAFDLLYPATNTIRAELAVLIQADLARIGIRVRPTQVEYTTFVAHQDSGDFDAMLSAWEEATKVDLASVWTTPSASAGSNNFYGYSNPEVDRLIAAAREEPDYTRAKVIFDRIQELIVADQPVTFLYEASQLVGLSRHIRGADINAASVFFNIEEWYWVP